MNCTTQTTPTPSSNEDILNRVKARNVKQPCARVQKVITPKKARVVAESLLEKAIVAGEYQCPEGELEQKLAGVMFWAMQRYPSIGLDARTLTVAVRIGGSNPNPLAVEFVRKLIPRAKRICKELYSPSGCPWQHTISKNGTVRLAFSHYDAMTNVGQKQITSTTKKIERTNTVVQSINVAEIPITDTTRDAVESFQQRATLMNQLATTVIAALPAAPKK